MATTPLTPLQVIFRALETRNAPLNVGGLYIFEPPEDAPAEYLRNLANELRSARDIPSPWNKVLGRGLLPLWSDAPTIDLDYHIRHSALPAPGGERELGELISRLHSHPLDERRPLWECHLIDGLYGGRFVLYVKVHQMLLNGEPSLQVLLRGLTNDPYQRGLSPVWGVAGGPEAAGLTFDPMMVPRLAGGAVQSALSFARTLRDRDEDQALPFACPRTMMEGQFGTQRRVATQIYDHERVERVLALSGVSHTELVQYLAGSALRRLLKEFNALPDQGLIAALPFWNEEGGQPVLTMAKLGTEIADPLRRLDLVRRSYARADNFAASVTADATIPYALGLFGPVMASRARGSFLPERTIWNVFLSCQEGPRQPLYFNGAKLDALYPILPLWPGNGLSVSSAWLESGLNVCLCGARDKVPHLQRIAVYMGEALEHLEKALDEEQAA